MSHGECSVTDNEHAAVIRDNTEPPPFGLHLSSLKCNIPK